MRATPYPRFSSEASFVLVALGAMLGTGSVWRFPRVLAQDGSAVLVPWLLGLVLWSYPLALAETAAAARSRLGLLGACNRLRPGRSPWPGLLLALAALGSVGFASIVSGWCLRYFLAALTRDLLAGPAGASAAHHEAEWHAFASGFGPLPYQVVVLTGTAVIVGRGVARGLERAHRVAVPAVLALLFALALWALGVPGASRGLAEAFRFEPGKLAEPGLWLRGLLQAAWSTAAGWGWLLTYAGSMPAVSDRRRLVARILAGAALASVLAALAVLPLALGPGTAPDVRQGLRSNALSLTFVWTPTLLGQVAWGSILAILLYGSLALATILTVVAMLECATRVAVDAGFPRAPVAVALTAVAALVGLPALAWPGVLDLEVWVLETTLIVGAGLLARTVLHHGPEQLYREVVSPHDRLGARLFGVAFRVWIPAIALVMLAGKLWDGLPGATFAGVFAPTGIGTTVIGVGGLVLMARAAAPPLVRWTFGPPELRPPLAGR